MKKEIKWTAGNGMEVCYIVELVTKEKVSCFCDGDRTDSVKAVCEIRHSATVNGKDCGSNWLQEVKNHPVVVACIGKESSRIGIVKANYEHIQAAVAELKSSEYYKNWKAGEAAADKELSEYYAHVARVEKMMNP